MRSVTTLEPLYPPVGSMGEEGDGLRSFQFYPRRPWMGEVNREGSKDVKRMSRESGRTEQAPQLPSRIPPKSLSPQSKSELRGSKQVEAKPPYFGSGAGTPPSTVPYKD